MVDIQVRADNNNEPFVLDDTAEVLNGITLAASQGDLTRGAVLGEVAATLGTYKLCNAIATDGSQVPKLILSTRDVDSDASTTTGLSGYSAGLFDENQLVFGGDTDIDTALNVELMPNLRDRDFSDSDGGTETLTWANNDINAFDSDGNLTITANSAAQYCELPVASAPTEIGGSYKMFYDLANIVATWTIKDFTGAQTLGTISGNATQGFIQWWAETTGGFRIVAVSDGSSGDFDNFKLQRSDSLSGFTMRDLLRNVNCRVTPGISVSGSENT